MDHTATGKIGTMIIAGLVLTVWTCADPFKVDVNDGDDPLLILSAETSTLPIYDTAFVDLSWPQLAVDDFTRFEITRYYINVVDSIKNKTLIRRVLRDPKVTAWQDTLYDDESVHYQLDVFTINGPAGSSEIDVLIPYTTKFQILEGENEFEDRARSILVDAGDTLQLGPGIHMVSDLDLTRKPLFIEGLGSAKDVIVKWYALPLKPVGQIEDFHFLTVSDAIIRNLTFTDGIAYQGGAILAFGNTKIINCIFTNNSAIAHRTYHYGEGGALYLSNNVEVSNCIIYSNIAENYGGAIYIDMAATDVKIINTTIYGNTAWEDTSVIYASYPAARFSVKNCILANITGSTAIHPLASKLTGFEISYNILDESWVEFDPTNSSQKPLFVDPANGDFHLATGSPGIDLGDPDPAYDDPNGSRNDMGAYGGPYGDW